ncbi:membrane protein [Bacillus phage Thornton]|uniref:Membrane protein n=1 Tax=Bacillus phage Thornton TaxID=2795746 RepID=A0A7T7GTR3_9CAUD|nr:membrane protein [Bacillus phage Thornton]QQM15014.1 membrane protein [Bacillus phage Thornton]
MFRFIILGGLNMKITKFDGFNWIGCLVIGFIIGLFF